MIQIDPFDWCMTKGQMGGFILKATQIHPMWKQRVWYTHPHLHTNFGTIDSFTEDLLFPLKKLPADDNGELLWSRKFQPEWD